MTKQEQAIRDATYLRYIQRFFKDSARAAVLVLALFAVGCTDEDGDGIPDDICQLISCPPPETPPPPACNDGFDNDGDGLIDMADTGGCISASDANETDGDDSGGEVDEQDGRPVPEA